jgi:hypothetical protein
MTVNGFGGFRVRNGQMTFKPWLPPDWKAVAFRLKWHGNALSVSANHTAATFVLSAPEGPRETVRVNGHEVALPANTEVVVDLEKGRRLIEASLSAEGRWSRRPGRARRASSASTPPMAATRARSSRSIYEIMQMECRVALVKRRTVPEQPRDAYRRQARASPMTGLGQSRPAYL